MDNTANWRKSIGEGSSRQDKLDHPLVHVSLRDTRAYAIWAGGRLPAKLEWEYVANIGLPDKNRSDSSAYNSDGQPIANT